MIVKIIAVLGIIVLGVVIFISYYPNFGGKPTDETYERIISSNNFSDGKFRNLAIGIFREVNDNKGSSVFKSSEEAIPKSLLSIPYDNSEVYAKDNTKVTWFGHSTILLEINNKKIFLDPMFSDTASPVSFMGPKRFDYELPMSIDDIPYLDAVIISHDHYDHLDYETIKKLKDKTNNFYVPLGVGVHLTEWGVEQLKIKELDWWEEANLDGITLVSTPSRHFSGRGLFNRNGTLWCSWVIKSNSSNVFYSGDGSYSMSFRDIGEQHGPFDLTLMECGQYNEAWLESHMMPEETVQAHIDLKGKLLMPIHWGAFKLSTHSWYEPVERALKKANELSVQVTTPKIGETVVLDKYEPNELWWKESD